MSNKWVNPQPKLVPQPYTNLLTERDIGRPPILETRHLGIDFGGLTAVADFNPRHWPHRDHRPDRSERRRQDHDLQPAHQCL